MLFGSCSACCCPDLSFIMQADAIEVELEYDFSDFNPFHAQHPGYSSSFSGLYTIPRSGQVFPLVPIDVDGKSYTLEFIFQPFPSISLIVNRLASPDSWRTFEGGQFPFSLQPPPFGRIGFREGPCDASLPENNQDLIPTSQPLWGDFQFTVGNERRPPGNFTMTFERDNVTAFTGSVFGFPTNFQTAGPLQQRNFVSWCSGEPQRAFYRESQTGSRYVLAEFSGSNEFLGDWSFSESLRILSLKAVFPEFSQNILFDVEEPVWSINTFRMQSIGSATNYKFDTLGFSTPCPIPFPLHIP